MNKNSQKDPQDALSNNEDYKEYYDQAQIYFNTHPNAVKYKINVVNQNKPNLSFIKIQDKIVRITSITKGAGSFGVVKIGIDQSGKAYGVKIERPEDPNQKKSTNITGMHNVTTGLTDITEVVSRNTTSKKLRTGKEKLLENDIQKRDNYFKTRKIKTYELMFLGEPLKANNSANFDERINKSIQIMSELESNLQANDIIHLDIKHDNMIEIDGKLKFIDIPNIKNNSHDPEYYQAYGMPETAASTPLVFLKALLEHKPTKKDLANEKYQEIASLIDDIRAKNPLSKEVVFGIDRLMLWSTLTSYDTTKSPNYFLGKETATNPTIQTINSEIRTGGISHKFLKTKNFLRAILILIKYQIDLPLDKLNTVCKNPDLIAKIIYNDNNPNFLKALQILIEKNIKLPSHILDNISKDHKCLHEIIANHNKSEEDIKGIIFRKSFEDIKNKYNFDNFLNLAGFEDLQKLGIQFPGNDQEITEFLLLNYNTFWENFKKLQTTFQNNENSQLNINKINPIIATLKDTILSCKNILKLGLPEDKVEDANVNLAKTNKLLKKYEEQFNDLNSLNMCLAGYNEIRTLNPKNKTNFLKLGYSRDEKLSAADKLRDMIINGTYKLTETDIKILQQGKLGEYLRSYAKTHDWLWNSFHESKNAPRGTVRGLIESIKQNNMQAASPKISHKEIDADQIQSSMHSHKK